MDPVELLLDELTEDGKWPTTREVKATDRIRTMRAFLDSDRDALKQIAGWPAGRDYKIDPLPALIADAWADHIFGEDLEIKAAAESDADLLIDMIEGNGDLSGELHEAARVVAGEGESWFRIYRDTEIADVPLLEWHSRDVVVPFYVGRQLKAAALVTELAPKGRSKKIYRHFEIHADEVVLHVLFVGTPDRIGQEVALDQHPDLAELDVDPDGRYRWDHGLPMLMGRVTNGRGMHRKLGIGLSEYERITDQLLDLNEATVIGAENVRLTAKKRIVVNESALTRRGPELVDRGDGSMVPAEIDSAQFDAGEDVLVQSKLDQELGVSADGGFKVLEYSFDATSLIEYKRDVVETATTRLGLTPQYIGVNVGEQAGLALSGTARRLMLNPTTKAGKGKARKWDDALPQVFSLMAQLDALEENAGGFARPWTEPETPPVVERGEAIPADEVEESQVEATFVGAGVRSRRQSIIGQHPDWTTQQVDEELAELDKDAKAKGSSFGGFA